MTVENVRGGEGESVAEVRRKGFLRSEGSVKSSEFVMFISHQENGRREVGELSVRLLRGWDDFRGS